MMNKHLITISIFGLFAIAAEAGQDFYKWVDDRGITHYSQSPPDSMNKDSKVETVNVRTRVPMGSEQAIADLEKKRAEAAKAREGDAKKDAGKQNAASVDAKQRELNKANCEQWKKDLDVLQRANVREDDGKGNVKTMTEEDKKKRLEQTQKNIKDYC